MYADPVVSVSHVFTRTSIYLTNIETLLRQKGERAGKPDVCLQRVQAILQIEARHLSISATMNQACVLTRWQGSGQSELAFLQRNSVDVWASTAVGKLDARATIVGSSIPQLASRLTRRARRSTAVARRAGLC
eukprot:COSAG02_NODE_3324_length_6938_cov_3.226641_1_plen_133_part_00